jgi:hypothetical protein
MKNSDKPKTYGQNSLIERHRKELEKARKFKADKYAELVRRRQEEEAKGFLAIRNDFSSEEEWKAWWEEGASEEFAKDVARGEVKVPLDESAVSEEPHTDLSGSLKSRKNQKLIDQCRAYAKTRLAQDRSVKKSVVVKEIKKTDWADWKKEFYGKNTVPKWLSGPDLWPKRERRKKA